VWEVDLEPRQQVTHAFELKKLSVAGPAPAVAVTGPTAPASDQPERPVPTSVYVGLAATGVLAAGGVVTGILAKGKQSDYDALNSDLKSESDRQEAQDLRDSGKTLNLVADVMFGGALVAGGVTAVLYFTRPQVAQSAFRIAPVVAQRGGGVFVQGSF
jgi:hypothetical protein